MDHRAALASLSPEDRRALTETSDGRGLAHLAGHLGAVALVSALILARVPFWPLLMLPQGILLIFLFTLLHETTHFTPFRSRWLNTAAGTLCGVLLILPPLWFRYFHLAHHKYNQDPARDPELAIPKPETRGAYLRHVSGLPVWLGQARTLWRNAAGGADDAFVPAARRPAIRREARAMLAGYTALAATGIAFGWSWLLTLWLIPLLLGQPFLRLFLLAEHGRCPYVANMLENSRTTFTTRLVRFLTWNMPYHAEHHSYPAVPFHRLPDLHRHLARHMAVTEQGYARFHRRYAAGLAPAPR